MALQVASRRSTRPTWASTEPTSNPSQAAASQALKAMVEEGGFQVALLDGVDRVRQDRGLLETADAVLAADPDAQVLILLPEIALTPGRDRPGRRPLWRPAGEWTDDVAPTARRRVWEAVAAGRCRIVVGRALGAVPAVPPPPLISWTRSTDGSFKKRTVHLPGPRPGGGGGKIEDAPWSSLGHAIAGDLRNAETAVSLAEALGAAGTRALPDIEIVDLRETPPEPGRWLSPPWWRHAETWGRGEQT